MRDQGSTLRVHGQSTNEKEKKEIVGQSMTGTRQFQRVSESVSGERRLAFRGSVRYLLLRKLDVQRKRRRSRLPFLATNFLTFSFYFFLITGPHSFSCFLLIGPVLKRIKEKGMLGNGQFMVSNHRFADKLSIQHS